MRINIYILPLASLLLLASCSVKKNVTPLTTEESQAMNERQKSDTLPDFLQPFAGDSTIHINYAYGIPFIIDDSVPMLLPPIDKEPKGYVSSQAYNEPNRGGGANMYADKISACGATNPIDNLLWLNKCINDLPEYIDNPFFPITHRISFFVQLYKVKDSADIILFSVAFFPDWECHSEEITLMQISVLYAFDYQNLITTNQLNFAMVSGRVKLTKLIPLQKRCYPYLIKKVEDTGCSCGILTRSLQNLCIHAFQYFIDSKNSTNEKKPYCY